MSPEGSSVHWEGMWWPLAQSRPRFEVTGTEAEARGPLGSRALFDATRAWLGLLPSVSPAGNIRHCRLALSHCQERGPFTTLEVPPFIGQEVDTHGLQPCFEEALGFL